ncbi:M56 family metallopeptidase [Arsenicibacter rosenii]|uniref:TonB C-terminal domain-containing protein n=1 Tax=Arsenicibacter rosenii TaxID=1750698 RepID=A0A1S2VH07_9BACT|nr:M56 family metallopeptidase [Arsenicibacter rosenii]OIN57700.1 hypothetical protein BLX24_18310 [Arsenicibacter rosenii]
MTILEYILRANLFMILFYACYWLFLRRHTFFALNRAYLLGSILASFALPLIELPQETVQTVTLPMAVATIPAIVIQPESAGPDWELIGWVAYGILALWLLGRLEARTMSLLQFIRRSDQQPMTDYTLVWPGDPKTPTFSFFRYLVMNPSDAQAEPVYRHELVHIRQWHSLDVVFFEVLQALFWFNPVVWCYKQSIRQIHEFLADKEAANEQYAAYLVEYAFGVKPDGLTNSFFNKSQLKARITMLRKQSTSRWALGKYLVILPLALGLLAMTTANDPLNALVEQQIQQEGPVMGQVKNQQGKALANVSVVLKGTTTGTTTDSEGLFELKNVPDNGVLVFSYVGLGTTEVEVKGRKLVNIQLAPSRQKLEEVVVVGYASKPAATTATSPATTPKNNEVFTVVEEAPAFPGGIGALGQYLAKNIRYPAEAHNKGVQGEVLIRFIVSETGSVRQPQIQRGIGSGCDEEALRVVLGMPRWNPGKQNGNPVEVEYVLPIKFLLEGEGRKINGKDTTGWNPMGDERKVILEGTGHFTGIQQPAIQLRGVSPLGKQPLYLVDGIAIDDVDMKKLDPNTIESISVLKGVSATAVYGERAVDGAIIIKTKNAGLKLKK